MKEYKRCLVEGCKSRPVGREGVCARHVGVVVVGEYSVTLFLCFALLYVASAILSSQHSLSNKRVIILSMNIYIIGTNSATTGQQQQQKETTQEVEEERQDVTTTTTAVNVVHDEQQQQQSQKHRVVVLREQPPNDETSSTTQGGGGGGGGGVVASLPVTAFPSKRPSNKIPSNSSSKKKRCSMPECTKQAKVGGLCCRHGGKVKYRFCNAANCSNVTQKGGYCKRHYLQFHQATAGGGPLKKLRLSEDGVSE